MRIVGPEFIDHFDGKFLNTHPALLPAFPGAHAVRDALRAGVVITGTTLHLVDAGVDTGPILDQRAVPIDPNDDEPSDRKSTRLNSSHVAISYAVFCLK